MIPGNPHPLLMSGGVDPIDNLGVILKSLRTRKAASGNLSRTPGVAGNRKTWTFNAWVKRSAVSNSNGSLFCSNNAGNQAYSNLTFDSNSKIYYLEGTTAPSNPLLTTSNAQYRDVAGHMNVHVMFDTTNATASLRFRVFINGAEITMNNAATLPLNYDSNVNNTQLHTLCANPNGGGGGYMDAYLSNVALVDGKALLPTAFGQFHPMTGEWRPNSLAGIRAAVATGGGSRNGWGTCGFLLPFDNPANTTTIGYDRSQSDTDTTGNNWTANNISVTAGSTYDSMTDTPTADFCTLNELLPINILTNGYYPILPTDGALKVTGSSSPPANFQNGTQIIKFKTYYEMLVGTVGAGTFYIGIQDPKTGTGYFYQQDGAKNLAGVSSAYGAAYTAGDRVAVCVDPVNRTLEFFKQTGGAGAFASQGVIATAFPSGDYVPFFYASNGTTLTVDFGQQGFANTSIPSGALALNTKNLPIPTNGAVIKPSTAFVTVTDSGANVQTTLANARAGWTNYIEIFKRRDASEGWRWRFSDDPGYALESNNTNAKIAFPALTGTSYLGEAIKVAVGNGVATGRLTHVNGVADTVTDGLGNVRKMVMLRNEAGGNWFVYHPELTAGKLLYLNLQNAETTDATLSNILANSFVVAAALASGTYRWIAFAEVEGFLKLWRYTGNGNADGPFHNDMLTPNSVWWKDADTGTNNWHTHDIARDPYNQSNANLMFNLSDAESSQHGMDLISNGGKIRNSASGSNLNGTKQIGVSFAVFPFRYANAR